MTAARHDRDAVLAAVDLDALADHLLGDHRHTPTRTWPCPKPDHSQTGRTPPVTTYRNRRHQQRWHCHGCGADGTAIDLLLFTGNHTVRTALDWLASHPTLSPRPARAPTQPNPPLAAPDIDGIDTYVTACTTHLHAPEGADALHWLLNTRNLDTDVIDANRIGYDPGPRRLDRPDGIPRRRGIVLPVLDDNCHAIFTQTRALEPDAPIRYLNTANHAAPNPQVTTIRPGHKCRTEPVLICEGIIDGLTAATAGLPAIAILSATTPIHRITSHLPPGLTALVAFDADPPGDKAAHKLLTSLAPTHPNLGRLRPPATHGDLNSWHTNQPTWHEHIRLASHARPAPARPQRALTLER